MLTLARRVVPLCSHAPRGPVRRWFAAAAAGSLMESIKELRGRTGAPMMDCKNALTDPEVDGDVEKAFDWLRKKGLAVAQKKSGRKASEGLVGVHLSDDRTEAAMVEVNSETDFVARTQVFQDFVSQLSAAACASLDPAAPAEDQQRAEELLRAPVADQSAADRLAHLVGEIRENIVVRRATRLSVPSGLIVPYVHNATAPNLGAIGVLVAIQSTSPDKDALERIGKVLALQVAAAKPSVLDRSSVQEEDLERERALLTEQAKASGKPDHVVAKMVDGRMRKFYQEFCLMDQTSIVTDGEERIGDLVKKAGKDIGSEISVTGFRMFVLGDASPSETTEAE